jgi:conjugative transposon TraK protein
MGGDWRLMFQHFKNIDTAFRHIKTFSIVLIVAAVFMVCFAIYKSDDMVSRALGRVHILYNGKLLDAVAAERKNYLPVELRDHIKTFHEDFFNLSPDEKSIQANVTRALYLADESAKKQYDNLKESGYYNNLISANMVQQLEVDSIRLGLDAEPYAFTCYATEKLIRSSSVTTRKLVTRGFVRSLNTETDNNPHGFLITSWEILENGDEDTKKLQP